MTQNYLEVISILEARYDEIGGCEFYRDIFPDNELQGELYNDFSHPNAIYLYCDDALRDAQRRLRRRIMLKDTWEEDYINFIEKNPMTLCSGLSYRQRSNKIDNAQKAHALIFDLDGVGQKEIENLILRFDKPPEWIRTLPMPTYLVASGNGVHLYYVFEDPIDLYPNIKMQMKALKYDLTFRIWEYKATSQQKAIQYQSINQGFRMVGSLNNKYGTEVRAFRIGGRVTLDYLNSYAIEEKNKVDLNKPFKPSKITRAEAKEAYPEWYQRVVVEKQRSQKKWDIKSKQGYALYDWWVKQADKVTGGHRYYFLMCMAIYACKCDVPKKKLRKDMQQVFEILRAVEHDNALTLEDIESALEAYSKEFYNFTIKDIETITEIRIERNKRNGRKQKQHMEVMRAVQSVVNPNWRDGNGRPKGSNTKEQQIKTWREEHPEGTPRDCICDTGISKNTVYKWWQA